MRNSIIYITNNPNPNPKPRFYQVNIEMYGINGTRDKNRSHRVATYISLRTEVIKNVSVLWLRLCKEVHCIHYIQA